MKRIYYPLKKEYPKLGLKLVIEDGFLIFSGNKTPRSLYSGDVFYETHYNYYIRIGSYSAPDISIYSNGINLYLGGTDVNDKTFAVSTSFKWHNKLTEEKIIRACNRFFKSEINKNIKTL